MKSLHDNPKKGRANAASVLHAVFSMALMGLFCAGAQSVSAQVVPAGFQDRIHVEAGGTASWSYLQYGGVRLLGGTAFADLDTWRHFRIEAEARFLEFQQTKNIHAETYLAGPIFHHSFGRIQPYAKGMVGLGVFHYPYGYGTDTDLVVAPGAGVDLRVSKRVHLRLIDGEYQFWPLFNYGAMQSYAVSTGFSVRIF